MLLEIIMDHDAEEDEGVHPHLFPYMDGGRVTGEDYRDLGM